MSSVDKLIKLLRDIDENPPKKIKHRKLKSIEDLTLEAANSLKDPWRGIIKIISRYNW